MTDKTKLGLRVLGFALVLGVMGDLLLRQVPWGLNALLWTAALGAFIVALGRDRPEMLGGLMVGGRRKFDFRCGNLRTRSGRSAPSGSRGC